MEWWSKDLVALQARHTEYQSRPKPLNTALDYGDPMKESSSGAKRAQIEAGDLQVSNQGGKFLLISLGTLNQMRVMVAT